MGERYALLIMLGIAVSASPGFAQDVCYQIRPGDTAAQLAARFQGNASGRSRPAFKIVDQDWRPVPTSEYGSIRPGWLACLTTAPAPGGGPAPLRIAADVREADVGMIDIGVVSLGSIIFGAVIARRYGVRYWTRRQERVERMREFALEFVREFGRPLSQVRGAPPPPCTRLRISPGRSRLDILLAPAAGRSYPNLSDHRGNVEYDVARVVAALGRESFVAGRPYAEGQWVVLPFLYKSSLEQESIR